MGNKSPRKLSTVVDSTVASNIGYALWLKHDWDNSEKWFLRALSIADTSSWKNWDYVCANRFLGWLSIRPVEDNRMKMVGALEELLYTLKYWLRAIEGVSHDFYRSYWGRSPESDIQVKMWYGILGRIQHNQKLLLTYWIRNCSLIDTDKYTFVYKKKEMQHHEFEIHKNELHCHPLIHSTFPYNKSRRCDNCQITELLESYCCKTCDYDACVSCYFKISCHDMIYKYVYQFSQRLYSNTYIEDLPQLKCQLNETHLPTTLVEMITVYLISNTSDEETKSLQLRINNLLLYKILEPGYNLICTSAQIYTAQQREKFAFYRIAKDINSQANLPEKVTDMEQVCKYATSDDCHDEDTVMTIPMLYDGKIGKPW